MRASTVAALSAGVVVVGVVTATTVTVGSSADREPLAPIVVHAPESAAPPGPAESAGSVESAGPVEPPPAGLPAGQVPMGATHADGVPAPPPALRPNDPAGGAPAGGWNDGWDDSYDDWDDSYDDWDDSYDDWDDSDDDWDDD